MGFFVRTGSRDEFPEVSGVSHFLEHMAFKGTERFSATDVNRIFDEIGARYNAMTSEELTLYYGAVLPEYTDRMFELLSSILYPSLRQDDFDTEKKVILEEIGMYDDQPSFVAYDKAMSTHFREHALGQSILGSPESIQALSSSQMRDYHRGRYTAGNITLAVAGKLDFEQIKTLAHQHCAHWPAGSNQRELIEAAPEAAENWIVRESSVQQHVVEFTAAPIATSPLRFAAELLSVVVGDDSGSRLYWELVDTGLAEAADLAYNDYDGCGVYMTYLCSQPERTTEIRERVHGILERVNREGITAEELEQARNKALTRIVLRGERPMDRLSSLGANWLYRECYQSVEDDLQCYQSITLDDIRELLEVYPLGCTTTVGVGPFGNS